jgi:uncharacterized protein
LSSLSEFAVLQLTTMIETSPSSESYTKPSHLDEARGHISERGITLPTGAYMLQPDLPLTPEASHRIQELVLGLAKALVDDPEAVSVEVIPEAAATVLRLRVASTDIGKVIGKQGRTARSIRTILSAASMKMQHRFSLDIVEEGAGKTTDSDSGSAHQA